jgi:hypothetical protein
MHIVDEGVPLSPIDVTVQIDDSVVATRTLGNSLHSKLDDPIRINVAPGQHCMRVDSIRGNISLEQYFGMPEYDQYCVVTYSTESQEKACSSAFKIRIRRDLADLR